jgi:hypothetical protein
MSPRRATRGFAARLGLFAVLFQAILFGWHHHDLDLADRLPAPVIEKPAAAPQVADDADGCEICQVLHHLTAAPIDITAARPPLAAVAGHFIGDDAFAAHAPTLAFHARAPPLA